MMELYRICLKKYCEIIIGLNVDYHKIRDVVLAEIGS